MRYLDELQNETERSVRYNKIATAYYEQIRNNQIENGKFDPGIFKEKIAIKLGFSGKIPEWDKVCKRPIGLRLLWKNQQTGKNLLQVLEKIFTEYIFSM